jgi:hypothetical protein
MLGDRNHGNISGIECNILSSLTLPSLYIMHSVLRLSELKECDFEPYPIVFLGVSLRQFLYTIRNPAPSKTVPNIISWNVNFSSSSGHHIGLTAFCPASFRQHTSISNQQAYPQ